MKLPIEDLEREKNPAVIFRGIVGSRAYGTANAESDTDTRGIFVVPSRAYARLNVPPRQVSDAKNDHTYYTLLRFCELMAEANPTTMEMLYLPKDCVLKSSPAYERLLEKRALFVTQRAVESHLGYAVSQMKKARGANKRVWNPWPEEPPKAEDYCLLMTDAKGRPELLAKTGVNLANCRVARLTKEGAANCFALYDYGEATGGVFRDGNLVVEPSAALDKGKRLGVLFFNEQAFESAKRQHRQYWDWKRNRNESRWVQQERGELDYDAKNMMHLTRLLFSGESIVKNGEPIVRFTGEKLEILRAIRRGEWSFERIMEQAERIQAEILARKNSLPELCDRAQVDALIEEVMERAGVA